VNLCQKLCVSASDEFFVIRRIFLAILPPVSDNNRMNSVIPAAIVIRPGADGRGRLVSKFWPVVRLPGKLSACLTA
jgi:hypothetical protein